MNRKLPILGLGATLALHAVVLGWLSGGPFKHSNAPAADKVRDKVVFLRLLPEPSAPAPKLTLDPGPSEARALPAPTERASLAAPPSPSAQEWAFAARYTLKNGKAYRYSWGQQVRSMMGTATEGPEQGLVRFRIEIAPDGQLVRLQTLWTTSATAERLARHAVQNMPPLPPTPGGKPLIFERTIAWSPFATDDPPLYKDDCLPDPPVFRNPFVWDGQSPQLAAAPEVAEKRDPQALEECLRQLPKDTIEAERAHDQRLMQRWGSGRREP